MEVSASMGGKVTIDKRTIEASYVYSLVNEYNNEYPTTFQVLRRYLKKQDYSDEDIQKIVEDECFDNVVSAVRYGDYLSNVKSIMEQFARIEYKGLGEINKYFEYVLKKRYGDGKISIDVYNAIGPALKRLEKQHLVEIIDNPEHEGWKLYKYIG